MCYNFEKCKFCKTLHNTLKFHLKLIWDNLGKKWVRGGQLSTEVLENENSRCTLPLSKYVDPDPECIEVEKIQRAL